MNLFPKTDKFAEAVGRKCRDGKPKNMRMTREKNDEEKSDKQDS